MAARMPMIATTIISSIKVKPCERLHILEPSRPNNLISYSNAHTKENLSLKISNLEKEGGALLPIMFPGMTTQQHIVTRIGIWKSKQLVLKVIFQKSIIAINASASTKI